MVAGSDLWHRLCKGLRKVHLLALGFSVFFQASEINISKNFLTWFHKLSAESKIFCHFHSLRTGFSTRQCDSFRPSQSTDEVCNRLPAFETWTNRPKAEVWMVWMPTPSVSGYCSNTLWYSLKHLHPTSIWPLQRSTVSRCCDICLLTSFSPFPFFFR